MKKLSIPALLAAIAIGLFSALAIWVAQPLNSYLAMRSSGVADSYLPGFTILVVLILGVLVTPLLRRIAPSLAPSRRQLALIMAITLVACVPTALIQSWPHALAHTNANIVRDSQLAEAHAEMALPESLYLDPIQQGSETPVSKLLIEQIDPDLTTPWWDPFRLTAMPWSSWVGVSLSWGSLLAFSAILMTGLALVVYPQWRENERLPFPLLAVQQALIQPPEKDGFLPQLYRSPFFWAGAIIVCVIYFFNNMATITDNAWPKIHLGWGFWGITDGTMLQAMSWWVIQGTLSFVVIGVAYFVPSRVAFSVWFTVLLYQIYFIAGSQFFAPFHGRQAVVDHRNGAVLGVAVVILWLGRGQWLAVTKSMFTRAKDDADRRNRLAGLIFLIGCIGVFGWQMWAGNALPYALLTVFMIVITSLVLARIVAETGLPIMGNSLLANNILEMLPIEWLTTKSIFLTNMVDMIIGPTTSRVSTTVAVMHGLGVEEEQSPRQQSRMTLGFLPLILVGMLVVLAVHLWIDYTYIASLDGRGNPIGEVTAIENGVHTPVLQHARGSWGQAGYNTTLHFFIGIAMAIAMQIGCLMSPLWPLHPAGLLMMHTEFIIGINGGVWASILLGWFLRRTIVTYGGAKAYRMARPVFFGIITGEVFSTVVWALVPALRILVLGTPAAEVLAH